jgi:ectoine hydroxylase-related dioxygenase (phytanoyl-CoA dioxygenase family)
MNIEQIKAELHQNGYAIVPNVLTPEEIETAKSMFHSWRQQSVPNFIPSHGIYKYHEVGHQQHSWYIRTNPNVQSVFKAIWNTDELITSFDGSCYISPHCNRKDNHWIHTDQAPDSKGLKCIQGFVSLTDNKERTFVVYEKSHNYHPTYFKEKSIQSKKNWHIIDSQTIQNMKDTKRVLHVPAGSLVLWDSRSFHANQYGSSESKEERIVQYICFFPKTHPSNTNTMQKKRQKYFMEKRTTSHWPAPIYVNSKQPQTFGDTSKKIDYSLLIPPELDHMKEDIMKII